MQLSFYFYVNGLLWTFIDRNKVVHVTDILILIQYHFQLKSSFVKLQGNIGHDSEVAAAEIRKSKLLAEKKNMECRLASSYQIRAQLQKQLHSMLMTQSQAGRKFTHSSKRDVSNGKLKI